LISTSKKDANSTHHCSALTTARGLMRALRNTIKPVVRTHHPASRVNYRLHCIMAPKRKRDSETSAARAPKKHLSTAALDPATNTQVLDGIIASRASPDATVPTLKKELDDDADFAPDLEGGVFDVMENKESVMRAAGRPPAVNSDYLPLPWKGRLGYVCLATMAK
jgi:hypothetical protein